jgi:predicted nucleic acid-binding protein
MSLIVDASVATKWFFQEVQWDVARTFLSTDLIAPDLILAEVGNAAWKRCRQNGLSLPEALAIMDDLPKVFGRLITISALALDAMRISATLRHPIYDCFYLALAERERVPLVTADRRLITAAEALGTVEARAL